jgi:hypothetical protein
MNSKMKEKQKNRRNRFNGREDDFILADLKVMRDDEELSPVPLDHFLDDEDAIDRLLIDADFDGDDEQQHTDALIVDDLSLANEIDEYFDKQSAMMSDAVIIDPETSDEATIVVAQEKNPETVPPESVLIGGIKPEQVSANPNAAGINALKHNGFEQENMQRRLNGCELKIKKTAVITYVSLGIGIVALISTIAMAVIINGMKTEISKLTELVSILEEDMSSLTEKNSEMKFNSNDSAIEQLNQKNSLSRQLQEQPQSAVETLKRKLTATVAKQATINKSRGDLHTGMHALEKNKTSEASVKKVSTKKQVQVKKAKNTLPAEYWSVNLVSYKEKGFAKSKAAKFVQKGVPVKVKAVDVNNATLYRLMVGGFKNKLEATSYATKIKKSLNLNSVSVDNNT